MVRRRRTAGRRSLRGARTSGGYLRENSSRRFSFCFAPRPPGFVATLNEARVTDNLNAELHLMLNHLRTEAYPVYKQHYYPPLDLDEDPAAIK